MSTITVDNVLKETLKKELLLADYLKKLEISNWWEIKNTTVLYSQFVRGEFFDVMIQLEDFDNNKKNPGASPIIDLYYAPIYFTKYLNGEIHKKWDFYVPSKYLVELAHQFLKVSKGIEELPDNIIFSTHKDDKTIKIENLNSNEPSMTIEGLDLVLNSPEIIGEYLCNIVKAVLDTYSTTYWWKNTLDKNKYLGKQFNYLFERLIEAGNDTDEYLIVQGIIEELIDKTVMDDSY